jgi:cytochrome c-type biogenesis protein CcmH/NrfG
MATTTHGDPQPIDLHPHDEKDEEAWDEKIEALLAADDIEGARAEFERQLLASVNSGDPVLMTREKWEELRLELHREAKLAS